MKSLSKKSFVLTIFAASLYILGTACDSGGPLARRQSEMAQGQELQEQDQNLNFARGGALQSDAEQLALEDFITLKGQINLPHMNELNLLGRRVAGNSHHAHRMGGRLDDIYLRSDKPPHTHEKKYQVVDPRTLALGKLLSVRAVPLPPPERDPSKFLRQSKDHNFEYRLDRNVYEGQINDAGQFEISVPPYEYGYMIAVDGAKVHFKTRLPGAITQSQSDIVMNLDTTLVGDASMHLPKDKQGLSNNEIIREMDGLTEKRDELIRALQYPVRTRLINNAGIALAKKDKGFQIKQASFSGCSGSSPHSSCYDDGDDMVYNLLAATDISDYASSYNSIDFSKRVMFPRKLHTQFSNGTDGVTFYPEGKTTNTKIELVNKFVIVTPDTTTSNHYNSWLNIEFDSSNVHSVGLTLQNGTVHLGAGGTHERRGFRFIAYDAGGSEIHRYNWYTSQESSGAGFYGMTSPTAIARIQIRMIGSDPYTLDNLTYADEYLGDSLSTDSVGHTIKQNLGWRATGNWTKQSIADNSNFSHPYYSSSSGNMRMDSTGGDAHSGGNYWQCEYGSTVENTLTAPAFTLSHLSLWDATDSSGNYLWALGTDVDATLGYDHSVVSSMRIPEHGTDKTGATIDAVNSSTEFEIDTSAMTDTSGLTANRAVIIGSSTPAIIKSISPPDGTTTRTVTLYPLRSGATTPAIGDSFDVVAFSKVLEDASYQFHEASSAMKNHWSHVHWQAYIGVDDAAQVENTSSTERYVEYSTDNGKTWRNAWWWEDTSHHGKNGVWWTNHMHPFSDSDMNKLDFNADGTLSTYFMKDGVSAYTASVDNNLDGTVDSDDSLREWDTEFYMEYLPLNTSGSASATDPTTGNRFYISDMEGATILYRFRFVGTSTPSNCTDEAGNSISCDGWKIDDVAFNNDDPDTGYFTNFDGTYDFNM